MCSINQTLILNPKVKGGELDENSICKKCSEKPDLILRHKDPFCKKCFIEYCTHKFRATLGKSKLMQRNDQVLLAYSGGLCSTVLAHLLYKAVNESQRKKMLITVNILFINDDFEDPRALQSRLEKTLTVLSPLVNFNFKLYATSFEMIFNDQNVGETFTAFDDLATSPIFSNENYIQKLTSTLQTFKTKSAKQEFVKYSKYNLISKIAKLLNCDKVFLADSGNNLAVKLLSGIAQGQGSHIFSEIGFQDARYDVPILRPLREFLRNEIQLLSEFLSIEPVLAKPQIGSDDSIQELTSLFINSLQDEYISTITTINKTGDKLTTNIDNHLTENKCKFCKSPLDTNQQESCSALNALCSTRNSSGNSNNEGLEEKELCYSCNIMRREMADKCLLYNSSNTIENVLNEYLIKDN